MEQNVYQLLLEMGAPPEAIQRIMDNIGPQGEPVLENRPIGQRGMNATNRIPMQGSRGIYGTPKGKPGVPGKLSYMPTAR